MQKYIKTMLILIKNRHWEESIKFLMQHTHAEAIYTKETAFELQLGES